MIYSDFQGEKISMLALGAMRLPTVGGNDSVIDEEKAQRLVDLAYEKGVNYFDTAWGYHSGKSELFMGKALKKYPRESFKLATKFPGYDLANFGKCEEIFEKQLEKCQVSYFDFYLFHNVCEVNIDSYLDDETYKTYSYLIEQKRRGRIRHLGFSVHGNLETTKRFLEAYGKDIEFCQIQLNYIDWDFQNARSKVDLLRSYGIPVWVMEPVRGGRLARLSDEHAARLKALRPDESVAAWAFRYLQGIPEVKVILSGMSDEAQLLDNLRTFEEKKPVTESEREILYGIAREMTNKTSAPCTACHYCVSHCPQQLDIPYLLELYNEHSFTDGFAFIAPMALDAMPAEKHPDACIGCRSCEAVCPQGIKISEVFKDFCRKLG